MVTKTGSVWAIDIGNNSLKALRLSEIDGTVQVTGFDNIQHGKIVTGIGVKPEERDELIALSLRQFVQENDLSNSEIAISVPSQNSFARFVNLPPVEAKRLPEIVKFEAAQQIPFDISEVQWDWQLMNGEHTSQAETRVGIFAIKNDVITSSLEHFSRESVDVNYVQMAPMALYNYLVFDRPELVNSDTHATVILNIGAECTDLVVCSRSTVWQRCIPMGGNSFTRAIAETFKLGFEKSEKLKRTAPMSKYARQILQAMKPVFAELGSETQRSLGFFTSSNPGIKLSKIIAMGGGTKMQGLLKYLQQTLQIPIERPDTFKKLTMQSEVSAAKFHENICDFGIVYGLGLQALGLGKIDSNLLPTSVARSMAWAAKARHFSIAAVILLLVAILGVARHYYDSMNYDKQETTRRQSRAIIANVNDAINRLQDVQGQSATFKAAMDKQFALFKYRDVIPSLYTTVINALPNETNTTDPVQIEVYKAFETGDVDGLTKTARNERKQLFITGLSTTFVPSIKTASFESAGAGMVNAAAAKAIAVGTSSMLALIEEAAGGGNAGGTTEEFAAATYGSTAAEGMAQPQDADDGAGFVVSITGYSPYKNINDLLDPVGAGDDRSLWGLVTRLMQLNADDPNARFTVYKKTEKDHFRLEIGDVEVTATMPPGIGMPSTVASQAAVSGRLTKTEEQVLIDPMTKEVISKTPEKDEKGKVKSDRSGKTAYKVNDRWFRLDIKFLWKDPSRNAVLL